jgi:pimeloyl-ACP methyl ester carboxylesterase
MVQLTPGLVELIRPIPEKYRKRWSHRVPTLVVNGELDISSPVTVARKELMPNLRNGKLVILSKLGHNDPFTKQDAFERLIESFYRTGRGDTSLFTQAPMNFTPAQRLTDMAKEILK